MKPLVIPLKCQKNMRSLEGYRMKDGRVIRKGLYRSGNLTHMQEEDKAILRELGIRDIVDFRSSEEVEEDPTPSLPFLRNHHISALHTVDGLENFYFFMLLKPHSTSEDIMNVSSFVRDGYQTLPFHNEAFQKVFDLMLASEDAILFHCSSGKDRTGVMAALILKLLGASEETIYEDYMVSNDYIMKQTKEHLQAQHYSRDAYETALYVCTVHPEFLQQSFDAILMKYDNFMTFFEQEYHLTKEKIKFIQNKYLR